MAEAKKLERLKRMDALRSSIRDLQTELAELEIEERRERQIESFDDQNGVMRFFCGSIGAFCGDLVYHAKRLNRRVEGVFNDIRLEASPSSDADALVRQWGSRERLRRDITRISNRNEG